MDGEARRLVLGFLRLNAQRNLAPKPVLPKLLAVPRMVPDISNPDVRRTRSGRE